MFGLPQPQPIFMPQFQASGLVGHGAVGYVAVLLAPLDALVDVCRGMPLLLLECCRRDDDCGCCDACVIGTKFIAAIVCMYSSSASVFHHTIRSQKTYGRAALRHTCIGTYRSPLHPSQAVLPAKAHLLVFAMN